MPYDDILCSWLVRSALVSLTILLIGSGAVLIWRQPLRRVRIIELVLAGCSDCTLAGNDSRLSAILGRPVASCGHKAAGGSIASPGEPMIEPAMIRADASSRLGSCCTASSRHENPSKHQPMLSRFVPGSSAFTLLAWL